MGEYTYMDGERERKRIERLRNRIVTIVWYVICLTVIAYGAVELWMEIFNAIPMEAFGG